MALILPERDGDPASRKLRHTSWILLILLAAAAFRLVALSSVPPGMTHDEADHGLTAWEIVNGARSVYFTVGYGREPLYDYATALVMGGTGPTILAARIMSVYFSLVMIAAVYAWARRAFGRPVGILTAAGLAVGFWPVMAGRQALRSIALPAMFALAVLFFWRGLSPSMQAGREAAKKRKKASPFPPFSPSPLLMFLLAGLLLGFSFYTYIPARGLWLAFPALVLFLGFAAPPDERQLRRLLEGLGLTLAVAAFVAAPLFFYLANNPGVEVRIEELGAPLRAAAAGDFTPLWANARGALRLFTLEGDQTWRYNLPGKPWLGPVMGMFFYAGLLVAGWLTVRSLRNRASSGKPGTYLPDAGAGAFLALFWLALGMAPVVITGPGLSTTQAIGALPVLYVFPALAMVAGCEVLSSQVDLRRRRTTDKGPRRETGSGVEDGKRSAGFTSRGLWPVVCGLLALALFAILAAQTARDYFGRWAAAPEVRVQYETAMVTALRNLNERGGAAVISTITPGRYHTPAVALMTLRGSNVRARWFDGRESLILPGETGATLVIPGFTPIPAALQPYLSTAALVQELPMRPDDLDRPVRIYRLPDAGSPPAAMATAGLPVQFGQHIVLLGYALATGEVRPGDTLELVTAWRLLRPLPDASLFAHVLGPDGKPVAVADSLGAPGEAWVAGDLLLQLHAIHIPAGTPAGEYPLAVGVYTRSDGRRLATPDGRDMVMAAGVVVADE